MKHRTPALLLPGAFSDELCKMLVKGFEADGGAVTGYAGPDGRMVVES
jgi:hypothetical protein